MIDTSDVLSRAHPRLRSESDPTSTIVRPIPIPKTWEPLIPPGVGVVWSHSCLGRSRPEPSGIVRSCLESSEVVWSRPESSGVVQCACDRAFHFVIFFSFSFCAFTSYSYHCFNGPHRTTPTPGDYG